MSLLSLPRCLSPFLLLLFLIVILFEKYYQREDTLATELRVL